MKIAATQIRPGYVLDMEGKLQLVQKISHRTPGNLRAFVQVEAKDIRSGNKMEYRFASTDMVLKATLEEMEYQYLFNEGDLYTFMNVENYEQVQVSKDAIGDAVVFLQDNMVVSMQMHEGTPIAVRLPDTVVLTIVEAEPVVKGQTASSSYKPAVLENGVRTMVPPHVESGTKVVIRTEDSSYVERFKEAN